MENYSGEEGGGGGAGTKTITERGSNKENGREAHFTYIVIIYPIERVGWFTKFMPICSRVLEINFLIRKIVCVQSLLLYIRGVQYLNLNENKREK
jgi:hypothetical protein